MSLPSVPNALSALRLALAPVLLLLAWWGQAQPFLWLLLLALLTDAVDGAIARRLGQVTPLGPKLDTWADVSIYLMLPLAVWWLWPEVIRRELAFVLVIVASITLPGAVGLAKFAALTSYHTWLVKLAAVATSLTAVWLILGGPAWPFRAAALLGAAAAVEQIVITLVLVEPRSDVRSLWHVLRVRRQSP